MMSEAENETELCGNCKHYIPVANFTIHEIHCKRKISVCSICEEPFPTTEMDEHIATEHAMVTCKCNMKMEKRDVEEHELSACTLRLVKCQFCELELAFNKLGDHEDYCGARTERCAACGLSVMIKNLKDHPKVCGKETEPKKPQQRQIFSNFTESSYGGAWFDPPTIGRDHLHAQLPSRFYGNSIITKSSDVFNHTEDQSTQATQNRETERTNLYKNVSAERHERMPEERSVGSYVYARRRPNFDSFRSLSLQNETRASFDSDLSPFVDFYTKERKMNKTSKLQNNHKIFSEEKSVNVNPPSTPSDNDIQLPCEFCEKLFPEQDLILHQSGCNRGNLASVFNRRHSPKNLVDLKYDPSFEPISQLSSLKEQVSTPQLSDNTSHSVLIPCEFCGIPMEEDILFHHQDQCDLCPESTTPRSSQLLPTPADDEPDNAFLEMPSARLSKLDLPPRYLKNFKENSDRQSYFVRSNMPRNLPSGGLPPLPSYVSHHEMRKKNTEENLISLRSQQRETQSSQYQRNFHTGFNSSARNATTRKNTRTKKLNGASEELEKEE
ncbi:TRAF-type zinc finger domain-containing protein 1 isoform X2 [Bombina bombina]|uniref:TRAF-type zinc finger domain-containing protein 1 isoform X2 n=1 Tax=Bombina bombina TaxID=8345 RepID=UPI00235B1D81|nr:TRAF-type zinc finger domain-containing protein 1 isoform X2 [Bombina bombina]